MLDFLQKVLENRIEQINKSAEREKESEADTSENIENTVNIDETLLNILNLLYEIKFLSEKGKISKRKRMKKINTIEVKLNNLFPIVSTSTEMEFDDIVILAIVYYNLGSIYVYTKDNLYTAKDHFVRCMELLKGRELHPKAILIVLYMLIQLNFVCKKLRQLENCYPLLDKAMELYLIYTKEENEYPTPFNINNTFIQKFRESEVKIENSKIVLINLHMLTLKYIVELYWYQPEDKHKFVIYVHNLLNKQLTKIIVSTNKMLIHWAKASADLVAYFLSHDRFIEAKVHLTAANYMMARYYTLMITDHDSGSSERDYYEDIQAHITRTWGTYGLKLLRSSKKRLQYQNAKSCEADNIKSASLAKFEKELIKPLIFVDLEKDVENVIDITDTYVSTPDDAKIIFVNVLKWLDIAKTYYTVEKYFLCYMELILNIFKAHKYYTYFKQSKYKQIKIIKRQIKILENAVTLFPGHEREVEYQCCKTIYFELAATYSTLLDITYEELDNLEEITDDMRMEIKQLAKHTLDNFNLYLCLKA